MRVYLRVQSGNLAGVLTIDHTQLTVLVDVTLDVHMMIEIMIVSPRAYPDVLDCLLALVVNGDIEGDILSVVEHLALQPHL